MPTPLTRLNTNGLKERLQLVMRESFSFRRSRFASLHAFIFWVTNITNSVLLKCEVCVYAFFLFSLIYRKLTSGNWTSPDQSQVKSCKNFTINLLFLRTNIVILQNLSWNLLCLASGVPSSKAHWIFSHPGTFVHQPKYLCFLERNAQFLQVYVPCTLIVILSWVGFWLNR